ncbi:DUF3164 family protein [uncultured Tateyamaria sp.]|uniref:DUF3164 family protein n=1 Tax=uncultured Tateyamaria sp. TaxID=455651 RepID=UPI002636A11D|nr:DUF3164 family protein [uncultured Tateyamaria sp.]
METNWDEVIIERPDGSTIPFAKLKPEDQLEHRLVMQLCEDALEKQGELAEFKKDALEELVASRQMLLDAYGIKRGGRDGGLTLRSACGRFMVKMTVGRQISFGKELEAAKELIFAVVADELSKGASDFIAELVSKVFSPNERGRIDTQGILNLRNQKCDDIRWRNAMAAIDKAVIRDNATTYVNFYRCDPSAPTKKEGEERIALDLAKV